MLSISGGTGRFRDILVDLEDNYKYSIAETMGLARGILGYGSSKGWGPIAREKKVGLIDTVNPGWKDLAEAL